MSTHREVLPGNEVANREPLAGSRKVYAAGPGGMRVPFREIALHPTKGMPRSIPDNSRSSSLP